MSINEKIGKRVRELRKEKQWTQTDLANAMGTSKAMIIELEAGKGNPTLERLKNVSKALGVKLEIILK